MRVRALVGKADLGMFNKHAKEPLHYFNATGKTWKGARSVGARRFTYNTLNGTTGTGKEAMNVLTRQQQRDLKAQRSILTLGLEAKLRILLQDILDGDKSKLQEFQQEVQYAPSGVRDRLLGVLDKHLSALLGRTPGQTLDQPPDLGSDPTPTP